MSLFRFKRPFAMFISHPWKSSSTALLICASAAAWANQVDEAGNLIATPREADMMSKGYLYFPPRVVRKPEAAKTEPPKPVATAELPKPEVVQAQAPDTLPAPPPPVAEPTPQPAAEPVKPASPPRVAGEKILITNPHNRLAGPANFATSSTYAGSGTSVVLGLSMPLPEGGQYRVELSDGFISPQADKSYGGSAYKTSRDEQHLGVFLDWSPGRDNWHVTGGLTLNNHHIKVQTTADASLTIDYKLPTLTPYVGVRYVHKAFNDRGWEGFAEVGLLLGQLNAKTTTDGSLSDATVQAEVDRIRKSIYQWSVVPKAVVGLSYKY